MSNFREMTRVPSFCAWGHPNDKVMTEDLPDSYVKHVPVPSDKRQEREARCILGGSNALRMPAIYWMTTVVFLGIVLFFLVILAKRC